MALAPATPFTPSRQMMRSRSRPFVRFFCTAPLLLSDGCGTFANVRSAEVMPGPSVAVQALVSTPTGEAASWFFSLDCYRCNNAAYGGDIGFTYGISRPGGGAPVALGVGVSGINPYVDGYVQLDGDRSPSGIGIRIATLPSWSQFQLYVRHDIPLGQDRRVLLNPAVFMITGDSPNGANDATFLAFVQGIGLELMGERTSFTPAIALVAGWSDRDVETGTGTALFATASLAVTFHRRRAPPR